MGFAFLHAAAALCTAITLAQAEPEPPSTGDEPEVGTQEAAPQETEGETSGPATADPAGLPSPGLAPPRLLPGPDQPLEAHVATTSVAAALRLGYRTAPASDELGPPFGVGFGLALAHVYAQLGQRIDLGAEVDLSHARWAQEIESTVVVEGQRVATTLNRVVAESAFVVTQVAAVRFDRIRPWMGGGGGLSVGDLGTEELEPAGGDLTVVRPVLRASAGVEVALEGAVFVGLRVDHTLDFGSRSRVTAEGGSQRVFDDFALVGITVGSRL